MQLRNKSVHLPKKVIKIQKPPAMITIKMRQLLPLNPPSNAAQNTQIDSNFGFKALLS